MNLDPRLMLDLVLTVLFVILFLSFPSFYLCVIFLLAVLLVHILLVVVSVYFYFLNTRLTFCNHDDITCIYI